VRFSGPSQISGAGVPAHHRREGVKRSKHPEQRFRLEEKLRARISSAIHREAAPNHDCAEEPEPKRRCHLTKTGDWTDRNLARFRLIMLPVMRTRLSLVGGHCLPAIPSHLALRLKRVELNVIRRAHPARVRGERCARLAGGNHQVEWEGLYHACGRDEGST
jgi:hypothetical protein